MIFDIVLPHDHDDEIVIIIMILIFYVIFIDFFKIICFGFLIRLLMVVELNTCNLHKVVYDLLHNIVLINYYVNNIVYPLYY